MWPPALYFSHWPFQATWDNTRSILLIVTSLGLTGCRVICFSDDFGLFLPSSVLGEGAQSVWFSSLFFSAAATSVDDLLQQRVCHHLCADDSQLCSRPTFSYPGPIAVISSCPVVSNWNLSWIHFFSHSIAVGYLLFWCIWKLYVYKLACRLMALVVSLTQSSP